jgi:thiosulfate/3-mercaptopyruvate sulfurtransferase
MNAAMPPLIGNTELASLLTAQTGDAAMLVVDCRFDLVDTDWGERAHAEAHLPGAIHAHLDRDLSGQVTPDSGRHPLPSPADFAATLARWGVTPATRIVAYDQGPGAIAARLWWMLRAAGHARAQVLDGGFTAWRDAGLAVDARAARTAAVSPGPERPFVRWLTSAQVRGGLARGDLLLVDARSAERFAGRNESIDPVAGHVPGAVNRPFTANLAADGRFLPAAELARQWRQVLGVHAPSQAAMMCGSGVTACHHLLSLEIAGLPGARLYAGSWSEWIRDPARPVAT